MLNRVTITGADGSISPEELVKLSIQYPFVEWGILVSSKRFGTNRFPSIEWLRQLRLLKLENPSMALSCHLCGQYVRDFCIGELPVVSDLGVGVETRFAPPSELWEMFERVQINTHGVPHSFDAHGMLKLVKKYGSKEFIFQYDNVNAEIMGSLSGHVANYSALFDLSHGAGISPDAWPGPLLGIKCGYAGGIGPDNIRDEIIRVEMASKGHDYWIDMETKVRSSNDTRFDVVKVIECLEVAREFVEIPK